MKSLEIVVEKIEHEKEILNELKRCHVNNGFIEEEEKIIEKYQKIKQDLEVLEIIKKKKVRIGEIKYYLKEFKEGISISITKIEDVLIEYNKGVALEDELTMEELLKLKQWLEVNE